MRKRERERGREGRRGKKEKKKERREGRKRLALFPGISPTNWFRPVGRGVLQSKDHVITQCEQTDGVSLTKCKAAFHHLCRVSVTQAI